MCCGWSVWGGARILALRTDICALGGKMMKGGKLKEQKSN
jgi:hypothetical protein